MEPLNHEEREARRALANQEELVERIARAVREDGTVEPLRALHLKRVSSATEPVHGVSIPAFCVIAQGSKEIYLGEDYYRYDPGHYLLATVELPIVIQIGEASKERPHLSLRLNLDPALVGSVMVEAGLRRHAGKPARKPSTSVPWMRACWTPWCDSLGSSTPRPKRGSSCRWSRGRSSTAS